MELAKELGITKSMLTNYEMETNQGEMNLYKKLSQIFGVSKSHVMGLTTDIETATRQTVESGCGYIS